MVSTKSDKFEITARVNSNVGQSVTYRLRDNVRIYCKLSLKSTRNKEDLR